MQTVDKAMELLGIFSAEQPEIGLSDLARRAQFDKATTRRLLVALANHGVIEQNPGTRKYRLGPALLRLARLREATVPLDAIVRPVLDTLVKITGETAHFVLPAGDQIATIAVCESPKSNRVSMREGEVIPIHATATGVALLAFSPGRDVGALIENGLTAYTAKTPTDAAQLNANIKRARRDGFFLNDEGYEAEVCSIASPVFGSADDACGAVAVAAPRSRFDDAAERQIRDAVIDAALAITHALGGEPRGALAPHAHGPVP